MTQFTDVPDDHEFAGDIQWAADNGITAGIGGGLFGPDQPVTRAQMAAFLRRLAKLQPSEVALDAGESVHVVRSDDL